MPGWPVVQWLVAVCGLAPAQGCRAQAGPAAGMSGRLAADWGYGRQQPEQVVDRSACALASGTVHMADSVDAADRDDASMDVLQPIASHHVAVSDVPGDTSMPQPHGRRRECEALDRLVAGLRAGASQMLVVRGEEGVGKGALLDYLAERATGCHVVRAGGFESERDLAFAGLHQMCAPLLGGLDQLPEQQRSALDTVFGRRTHQPTDRLVVGMAVMGLLTIAATDRPLLCILDDAQWLDDASTQTVGFVARRLIGMPVAIAISTRTGVDNPDLQGVPELVVPGLSDGDARALLRSSIWGPFDEHVQERIATEARGNPLALQQATTGLGPAELAGGFGLPRLAIPLRMEQAFRKELAPLSAATRRFLLLAAAEPTGDAVLLWAAADRLGISVGAAAAAVSTGLVELDGQVKFCHPLVRSIVYQASSAHEQRRVHQVLAAVTDPEADADRRAWHRAHAAADVDERAANALENTAERARARGGLPAISAFSALAAELTVEPETRARRALRAAEMNRQAGSWGTARRMLAMAQSGPLDELQRAQAQLLHARLASRSDRGGDASLR